MMDCPRMKSKTFNNIINNNNIPLVVNILPVIETTAPYCPTIIQTIFSKMKYIQISKCYIISFHCKSD